MASLKEVKTRINSVKSTRKISNEDGGFCQITQGTRSH